MKKLFSSIIFVLLLVGCTKRDVRFPPVSTASCAVSHFTSLNYYDEFSLGMGMLKTFVPGSGAVQSLQTAITLNYGTGVDSLFYTMTYKIGAAATVLATVRGLKKHFLYTSFEYPRRGAIVPDPERPDETYNIEATFDLKKARLLSISGKDGSFIMKYSASGKLTEFGKFLITYNGSDVWDIHSNDNELGSVQYLYDETKTAKFQFYFTTGYILHEYYNLAEACDWIPVQPTQLRTTYATYTSFNPVVGPIPGGQYSFSNHVVDANGYLQSYQLAFPVPQTITNFWRCKGKGEMIADPINNY